MSKKRRKDKQKVRFRKESETDTVIPCPIVFCYPALPVGFSRLGLSCRFSFSPPLPRLIFGVLSRKNHPAREESVSVILSRPRNPAREESV